MESSGTPPGKGSSVCWGSLSFGCVEFGSGVLSSVCNSITFASADDTASARTGDVDDEDPCVITEREFTMVDFAQSITAMSEPSKDWEAAVADSQIIDNNPVMDWMVSCASIKEDANGNIKVIKPEANKTSKRIDGVITSIMANNRLENALAEEARESYFDVDNAIY